MLATFLQTWIRTNWAVLHTVRHQPRITSAFQKTSTVASLLTQPTQSGGNCRKFQLQINFLAKTCWCKSLQRVCFHKFSCILQRSWSACMLLRHPELIIPNRNASPLLITVNLSSVIHCCAFPLCTTIWKQGGYNVGNILGDNQWPMPQWELYSKDERGRIANPADCASLVETTQSSEWPRIIQLSADTGRSIIRSLAKTNKSGRKAEEKDIWMTQLCIHIVFQLFSLNENNKTENLYLRFCIFTVMSQNTQLQYQMC